MSGELYVVCMPMGQLLRAGGECPIDEFGEVGTEKKEPIMPWYLDLSVRQQQIAKGFKQEKYGKIMVISLVLNNFYDFTVVVERERKKLNREYW